MIVRAITLIAAAVCMAGASGCTANPDFRWPAWGANHPTAENAAYMRHDPFSMPEIGPRTFTRPRGYETPRAEARQAAEMNLLRGLDAEYAPQSPQLPPSSKRHSGSVQL